MKKKSEKKYKINKRLSEKEVEEKYGKNFNNLLANLLFARKIIKKEEVEKFLNPKWEDNFDPFLFNDMEKTTERILKAIKKKEKILIFSDYDTDGIPGGVVLRKFFEKIGYKNFANFIPNRNRDGYGLTKYMAENIKSGYIFKNSLFGEVDSKLFSGDEKFIPELVITIDCGITDIDAGKILSENKIDLIITDHHLPKEKLPKAYSILNHKVVGEKYPDKNLCGAGVIFKLVQALVSKNDKIEKGWEKWLLDLIATSTVCDMVPLLGENRIFVKYGQIVYSKTKNIGLKRIIEKARLDKNNISAEDIGFMIGPRINAAARLEDPFFAFKTLSEDKIDLAVEAADYLEKLNNRRKYLLAKSMKDVWKRLENRENKKVIVIGNKDWPLGILGLIAGKIADKFKVPAFVWSQAEGNKNEELKGSCRGGGEYSIFSLMEKSKEEFIGYGGHAASGGFVIDEKKIHFLEEKLEGKLSKSEKIQKEKIIIDAEISIDDVNIENYNQIEKLAPYGMKNQKPIFLFREIKILAVKEFGKEKNHLELNFLNSKGSVIKAITFYHHDFFGNRIFETGESINLLASFEMNRWNGYKNLRLKIEEIN